MDIGNKIRQFRESADLSARALAKITNLDPSQISKIERGMSKPSLDALERICKALNVSLAEFFQMTKSICRQNSANYLKPLDHYQKNELYY
ncbi:MAG TPA: helix-turn-helix transcriptional regulator [Bacillota bacterium]